MAIDYGAFDRTLSVVWGCWTVCFSTRIESSGLIGRLSTTCDASPPFICSITPWLSYLVAAWRSCLPWSTYDLTTTPGSVTARPCHFGIGCGGSEAPPPHWFVFLPQSWQERTWRRWRKRSCPVVRVTHVAAKVGRWSTESLWITWIGTETITTTISGRTCLTGTSTACRHPRPCLGHLREAAETVPAGAARPKGGSMRYRYCGRMGRRTMLQTEVNMTCLDLEGGRTSASPELLLAHQAGSREPIIKQGHTSLIISSVYHQPFWCHWSLWSYAETENVQEMRLLCWWCNLMIHSPEPPWPGSLNEACVHNCVCVHDCV